MGGQRASLRADALRELPLIVESFGGAENDTVSVPYFLRASDLALGGRTELALGHLVHRAAMEPPGQEAELAKLLATADFFSRVEPEKWIEAAGALHVDANHIVTRWLKSSGVAGPASIFYAAWVLDR